MTPALTVAQVATALSTRPKRVRQLIADGELRAWRLGHEWRVDEVEIARFKSANQAPAPTTVAIAPARTRRRRFSQAAAADSLPAAQYFR